MFYKFIFKHIKKSKQIFIYYFVLGLNESFNCHPHYEGCEPPEPPCSASAVSPTSPHKHDNPVPANSFRSASISLGHSANSQISNPLALIRITEIYGQSSDFNA